MKRLILSLAILTLLFSSHRANAQRPIDPLPRGWLMQLWAYSPSSPTTVSTASGYVPMTGTATTFTTNAQGVTVEAEFNVQFGASNANVANCIADISISGFPTASYGTDGFAQPSYSLGGYVSTTAKVLYMLPGSTSYTITPQVAARGVGGTCIITGASFWVREFTAEQ
jgi:hypothetical protein